MYGRGGADSLVGGAGVADYLDAGDDDDEIDGRGGQDTILAGAGNDLIRLGMPTARRHPIVQGGGGDDFIVLTATTGSRRPRHPRGTGADIEIASRRAQPLRANSSRPRRRPRRRRRHVTIKRLDGTGVDSRHRRCRPHRHEHGPDRPRHGSGQPGHQDPPAGLRRTPTTAPPT